MSNPQATYWRADGGIQTAPGKKPYPPRPQPPKPDPPTPAKSTPQPGVVEMFYLPTPLVPVPWAWQPAAWLKAPVGVSGLCTAPPPAAAEALVPPPPAEKQEEKKATKEKKAKKFNANAAPSLAKGVNYMYPREHTILHIFRKAAPVWEGRYRGRKLEFKVFKVSVQFTVKMVVENVLRKSQDADVQEVCKGWAVTETVEGGNGTWEKGTTIEYESEKAGGSLESMGWSAKRGGSLPPVWLVVHKVDLK